MELLTGTRSFGSLGQAIGEKEKQFMKKKIVYTAEPVGDVEVVADFFRHPPNWRFVRMASKSRWR